MAVSYNVANDFVELESLLETIQQTQYRLRHEADRLDEFPPDMLVKSSVQVTIASIDDALVSVERTQ
jgi:hypothetical protein